MKILITEDDDLAANALVRSFGRFSTVMRAATAAEAVGLIGCDDWDGLVLDMWLGSELAIPVLDAFRSRFPHAPLVVLSGGLGSEMAEIAITYRAYFVPKPGDGANWVAAFRARCEEHRGGIRSKLLSAGLSSREVEVIAVLAQGDIAREAATTLGISVRTAEGRVRKALKRSDARNLLTLIWRTLILSGPKAWRETE